MDTNLRRGGLGALLDILSVAVASSAQAIAESVEALRLRLADGRTLAWQDYGDPAGPPLFVFHGFPGCRLQARLVREAALAAHVRLIAADRPGFGASSPHRSRTILGWAQDVAALADHLGYARFGLLGISCGGAYALACAHAMPQRLHYVGLLAGMGPMDLPRIRAGQLPPVKLLFGLARLWPPLAAPLLAADAWLFRRDPERAIATLARLLSTSDREALDADPEATAWFAASFLEAYRQGIGGAVTEAALIARPRGFELADIPIPVYVYQGGHDNHVPPAMGRHLAASIPLGRLRFYPDEGHLSIVVNCIHDCLADFRDTLTDPTLTAA